MDATPFETRDALVAVTQIAALGLALVFAAVLMLGFYLSRLLRSAQQIEAQLLRSAHHVEAQLHHQSELLSWMGKISALMLERVPAQAHEPVSASPASAAQPD